MPENTRYVGRPGPYGNPILWTAYPTWGETADHEPYRIPDADRRRWAVSDFKAATVYAVGCWPTGYPTPEQIREELAWLNLACWCPLSTPCHADILLAIANPGVCPMPA